MLYWFVEMQLESCNSVSNTDIWVVHSSFLKHVLIRAGEWYVTFLFGKLDVFINIYVDFKLLRKICCQKLLNMDKTHDFVIRPLKNMTSRKQGKCNCSSWKWDSHNQTCLLKTLEKICHQLLRMIDPSIYLTWMIEWEDVPLKCFALYFDNNLWSLQTERSKLCLEVRKFWWNSTNEQK